MWARKGPLPICMCSWQAIINIHVCVLSDHFFASLQNKQSGDNGDEVKKVVQQKMDALEAAQARPEPMLKRVCDRDRCKEDKFKIGK